MNKLGRLVREARGDKSRADTVRDLDVSYAYYYQIERGRKVPTVKFAEMLSKELRAPGIAILVLQMEIEKTKKTLASLERRLKVWRKK